MAGLRLPIESHVLQAFVSEGLKPFVDTVVTFGAGHFYVSQSDKGGLVFGGDIDGYNSYAQRGNLAAGRACGGGGLALVPGLSRVRTLRAWGGVVDMSMDGSPIIDRSGRQSLPERRLVLWRLQGDAGFRLLLRAPDREGGAARDAPGLPSRPVRARASHRRKGRRRPSQSALRGPWRA